MPMLWSTCALCVFGLCLGVQAQTAKTEQSYTFEAALTKNPDGTVTIGANSPRPLWQALNVLYSKYGIEVDYEDPHYSNDQLYGPAGVGRRLRGGGFTATLPLAENSSVSDSEKIVSSLVKQYDDVAPIQFRVHPHTHSQRIDVIPVTPHEKPLLNTPVLIDGENLSVEEVINKTVKQVAKVSGSCLERAGIVDNSLAAQKTSFKTNEAIPARDVLAQVLDEMETKKIWLLTYEPQSECFYLGIFSAQVVVDNQRKPAPNSHKNR